MNTDDDLLRRFVDERSEAAFTELVRRHLSLVRTTALRRVGGDAHAADDVTQQVFVALARKAPALRDRETLAGWLYQGTHHATAEWVRREQRRKQREAAASSMNSTEYSPDPSGDAARIRPLLDDALVTLKPDDREAIVRRFFSGQTFSEIGDALALSEEAARKRVDRALAKLHAVLLQRGVTSPVTALSSALTVAGVEAVPTGLAAQVAGVALTKAAMPSLLAAAAGVFWPAAAVTALVGGTFGVVNQHQANAEADATIGRQESGLREAIAVARSQNRRAEHELASLLSVGANRQRPAVTPAGPMRAVSPSVPPVKSMGVSVSVSPEGALRWSGQAVRLDEFLVLLAEYQMTAAEESRIVVDARGARFRQLNWVLDEVRKTGISHLIVDSDAAPVGPMNTWF